MAWASSEQDPEEPPRLGFDWKSELGEQRPPVSLLCWCTVLGDGGVLVNASAPSGASSLCLPKALSSEAPQGVTVLHK